MTEKIIKKYFDEKRSKSGLTIEIPEPKNKNKFKFIGQNCLHDQISVVKKSVKKSKYYYEIDLILFGCIINTKLTKRL
jgi:hypothetical protein